VAKQIKTPARHAGENIQKTRETSAAPPPYLPLSVTLRCGAILIDGYADSLTGAEIVVQSLGAVPDLDGECEVTIDLLIGSARARGSIASVDRDERTISVVFTTLEDGGHLLLAAAIAQSASDAD
jgi:hypothetical protein